MTLHRYTPQEQPSWDAFVQQSRNGTFLFERGYMDYHSDRFADHSLMYSDAKGRLVALLPANEEPATGDFYSHRGLTYGGFVLGRRAHAADVEEMITLTLEYLRSQGFRRWHYKPVPNIYHQQPSQEDEYFLWRQGATMEGCNLSCTLDLHSDLAMTADASRRRRQTLCRQAGLRLLEGGIDLPAHEALRRFWPIMEQNMMERFQARPVHTFDEMLLLQGRFPAHIRCYLVHDTASGRDLAGEVLFVSRQVAHAQYGHCNAEGRACGALDFLYLTLIGQMAEREPAIRYFDFGTSNEQGGQILNHTLIAQKEGFGGRGVAYRSLVLNLDPESR